MANQATLKECHRVLKPGIFSIEIFITVAICISITLTAIANTVVVIFYLLFILVAYPNRSLVNHTLYIAQKHHISHKHIALLHSHITYCTHKALHLPFQTYIRVTLYIIHDTPQRTPHTSHQSLYTTLLQELP